jgi:hypothetical protein
VLGFVTDLLAKHKMRAWEKRQTLMGTYSVWTLGGTNYPTKQTPKATTLNPLPMALLGFDYMPR